MNAALPSCVFPQFPEIREAGCSRFPAVKGWVSPFPAPVSGRERLGVPVSGLGRSSHKPPDKVPYPDEGIRRCRRRCESACAGISGSCPTMPRNRWQRPPRTKHAFWQEKDCPTPPAKTPIRPSKPQLFDSRKAGLRILKKRGEPSVSEVRCVRVRHRSPVATWGSARLARDFGNLPSAPIRSPIWPAKFGQKTTDVVYLNALSELLSESRGGVPRAAFPARFEYGIFLARGSTAW